MMIIILHEINMKNISTDESIIYQTIGGGSETSRVF